MLQVDASSLTQRQTITPTIDPMPRTRKLTWISAGEAAPIAGLTRTGVLYRALSGRYRSKKDERTGTLLVHRGDVEKVAEQERKTADPKSAPAGGALAVA